MIFDQMFGKVNSQGINHAQVYAGLAAMINDVSTKWITYLYNLNYSFSVWKPTSTEINAAVKA